MTAEPSPLKDAIMDAVHVPLERDDMQTPCALPFMTSSEHGVCDGDGRPVSDESIASALNAVAKIQAEYYRVKKEPKKETQKEMTAEPSPRPWRCECGPTVNSVIAANGAVVVPHTGYAANAALIVAAVNERDRLRDVVRRLCDELESHYYEPQSMDDRSVIREARAALAAPARNCDVGTEKEQHERFVAFCDSHGDCLDCPIKAKWHKALSCGILWAQMPFVPAEGGAE